MELNLKAIRKERGITQQELARMVGATKRQIGAWERGENDIPMDFAVSISEALECSIDEIAGRSDRVKVARSSKEDGKYDWFSPEEIELLSLFRRLDDSYRKTVLETVRGLAVASEKMSREIALLWSELESL